MSQRRQAERRITDNTLPWNAQNGYDLPVPGIYRAHTEDDDSSVGDSSIFEPTLPGSMGPPRSSPSISRSSTPLSTKRHRSQVSNTDQEYAQHTHSRDSEYAERIQSLEQQRDRLQQQLKAKELQREIDQLARQLAE